MRELQNFLEDLSQVPEREVVVSEIEGEEYFGPEEPTDSLKRTLPRSSAVHLR